MFDSETCFGYAWSTLVNPASAAPVMQLFKTPWPGDPRVNIQEEKGKAKAYQVRQVLAAIDKPKGIQHESHSKKESKS
jgi:hypothetical protein